jgi:hypothetical protein
VGSVIPDPYGLVPAPQVTPSDPLLTFACSGGDKTTYTIYPGVYSSFQATGKCTVIMEPGIYIFEGSMTIGGTVDVEEDVQKVNTNSGVMLYFTCPGYDASHTTPCSSYTAAAAADTNCTNYGLNINSTHASLSLVPPSSGIYQGMGVFYDRTLDGHLCLGGSTAPSLGTIYAKTGEMDVNGNAGTQSAVVVQSLTMAGGSTLSVDGTVNGGAAPMNSGSSSWTYSSYAQIAG